jgi:hypothetical protein
MIGVLSKPPDKEIIEEFFQLFKTPWEFYNSLHQYDVLLAVGETPPESDASLIVIYAGSKLPSDVCDVSQKSLPETDAFVVWENVQTPIYKGLITFSTPQDSAVLLSKSGEILGYEIRKGKQRFLRIGYDLFQEVFFLLTKGQPPENALIPTLDIYISMLRSWILNSGIPLVEIPPVPAGYNFIACLTHDVDFVGIRDHKFDHSMWGFVYRATILSLIHVLKGRNKWKDLFQNWRAALSLPFVYLGICRDFWFQFDRYMEIEKDVRSTFFLIPFKCRVGNKVTGRYVNRRATKYDIRDIPDIVKKLINCGFEVGVHGIDAWHDKELARQELNRISEVTGRSDIGIRMHWLCFNETSPQILEEAGFFYDSTFGYNDAVGYRVGSSQVFKPIGVKKMLELPLHIQDIALFNSQHMGLSNAQAWDLCKGLIEKASAYGGVLTILWHQRSLGPERLYEAFYIKILEELKSCNVWFATANQVIKWTLNRRAIMFEKAQFDKDSLSVKLRYNVSDIYPQLLLRIYHPNSPNIELHTATLQMNNYVDIPLTDETNLHINLHHFSK